VVFCPEKKEKGERRRRAIAEVVSHG